MKHITLPGRLSRRSVLIIAVVAAIGIISLVVMSQDGSGRPVIKKSSDIPLALATALADLRDTTTQLDKSLDAMPNEKKDAFDQYLTLIGRMNDDCLDVKYLQQTGAQLQVDTEVSDMLEQNFRLCSDLADLTAYSSKQYHAVAPVFTTSSSFHRYESIPPLSGLKKNRIRQAVAKSQSNLKQLTINPQFDYSSSDSLATALSSNAPTKEDTLELMVTKLRTARMQIIAQRVNYWRSQAAIGALRNIESQRLNDSCAYLTRSNTWPKFCPRQDQ